MPDLANLLHGIFAALVAVYVCVHTALTIFEVKTEESLANIVPAAFRQYVSLAQHRKAVDYTGEVLQSDLVGALVSATIAVVLTFGGGFSVLLACITALLGQGLAAQFTLAGIMVCLLALIDFPISWWRDFRINERYGFERTECSDWLKERLTQTVLGGVTLVPLLLSVLVILISASYHWWLFAATLTSVWFIWRISVSSNWFIGFSSRTKPMAASALTERLHRLLVRCGWPQAEICYAQRPATWRHGNAILAHRPGRARLVIFTHVLERLNDEEITAIAACALGRVVRWHNVARLAFFLGLTWLFWWGLAWLAEKPFFYQALNIEPSLAIPNGTVNPALLFCMCITLVPVVLYPVVFLVHAFTRMLDYDEDAFAARMVGAKPLVRAIAKLHRDYRTSLTPHALYSLANHRRPHVTQRIAAALSSQARSRRQSAFAAQDEQKARAMLYNSILAKRQAERQARIVHRVRLKTEKLREAANLRTRGFSLPAKS